MPKHKPQGQGVAGDTPHDKALQRGIELEKSLQPSTQDSVFDGFRQGSLLGYGCFGSVWSFSYPHDNRSLPEALRQKHQLKMNSVKEKLEQAGSPIHNIEFILKVSSFEHDKTGYMLDSWKREVFFLRHLRDSEMVPGLLMAEHINQHESLDNKKGLQLMERFAGNVKQLGLAQSAMCHVPSAHRTLTFTYHQITQMVYLAKRLDEMGIIHGDFKFSNLLYRLRAHQQKQLLMEPSYDFRVADFGFAGFANPAHAHVKPDEQYEPLMGYLHHYGLVAGRKMEVRTNFNKPSETYNWFTLQHPIPVELRSQFNQLSLYICLVENERVCVGNLEHRTATPITGAYVRKEWFPWDDKSRVLMVLYQYLPGLKRCLPPGLFELKRLQEHQLKREARQKKRELKKTNKNKHFIRLNKT